MALLNYANRDAYVEPIDDAWQYNTREGWRRIARVIGEDGSVLTLREFWTSESHQELRERSELADVFHLWALSDSTEVRGYLSAGRSSKLLVTGRTLFTFLKAVRETKSLSVRLEAALVDFLQNRVQPSEPFQNTITHETKDWETFMGFWERRELSRLANKHVTRIFYQVRVKGESPSGQAIVKTLYSNDSKSYEDIGESRRDLLEKIVKSVYSPGFDQLEYPTGSETLDWVHHIYAKEALWR